MAHPTAYTTIPTDLPLMLDVRTCAALLGVCEKHVRDLCANGTIGAVKVGAVWRIGRDAFLRQFGLAE